MPAASEVHFFPANLKNLIKKLQKYLKQFVFYFIEMIEEAQCTFHQTHYTFQSECGFKPVFMPSWVYVNVNILLAKT